MVLLLSSVLLLPLATAGMGAAGAPLLDGGLLDRSGGRGAQERREVLELWQEGEVLREWWVLTWLQEWKWWKKK